MPWCEACLAFWKEKCLVWRLYAEQTSPAYRVSQCVEWRRGATFTMDYEDAYMLGIDGLRFSRKVSLVPGQRLDVAHNISVGLLSPTYDLVTAAGFLFLSTDPKMDSALLNEPHVEQNRIRCPTANNSKECKWPRPACDCTPDNSAPNCYCSPVHLREQIAAHKFPTRHPNHILYRSGDDVFAEIEGTSTTLFSIEANNASLRALSEYTKCDARFVNVSGSTRRAEFFVGCKMDYATTPTSITTGHLDCTIFEIQVSCGANEIVAPYVFQPPSANGQLRCNLTCSQGAGNASIDIAWAVSEETPFIPSENRTDQEAFDGSGGGGGWLGDALHSAKGWLGDAFNTVKGWFGGNGWLGGIFDFDNFHLTFRLVALSVLAVIVVAVLLYFCLPVMLRRNVA